MTKRQLVRFSFPTALIVIAVLCLAAFPALAQKTADKFAEDRATFRKSVEVIRGQIDTTLGALDGIVQGKDSKARSSALKKYTEAVKEMEKQIDKTAGYAKDMRERGQDYFKDWEKSMKSVKNDALKASATERREALDAQYKKIEAGIEQAKQVGPGFRKNLQDLQKYYSNDLSSEAIATSAKLVETTTADGKKIQGYIDDVMAATDQVGAKVEEKAAPKPAEAETPPPAAEEPAKAETPEVK